MASWCCSTARLALCDQIVKHYESDHVEALPECLRALFMTVLDEATAVRAAAHAPDVIRGLEALLAEGES